MDIYYANIKLYRNLCRCSNFIFWRNIIFPPYVKPDEKHSCAWYSHCVFLVCKFLWHYLAYVTQKPATLNEVWWFTLFVARVCLSIHNAWRSVTTSRDVAYCVLLCLRFTHAVMWRRLYLESNTLGINRVTILEVV